jgi:hypothetical protein
VLFCPQRVAIGGERVAMPRGLFEFRADTAQLVDELAPAAPCGVID